jgi:hypothetical protein
VLDGRDGFDTAVFAGSWSAYSFTRMEDGWTVMGPDGTDRLFSIEALRFDDRTLFTVTGDDATIARPTRPVSPCR